MELVNANCTNLNFENLMCIAVNYYVKSTGHQEALTSGTNVDGEQMQLNGFELWSNRCMLDYWKFVEYVAVLDDSRWLKQALTWNAGGGRGGRSCDLWDAPVTKFCKWQNIGSGRLQPRTKLSACSTCRISSHLCICYVRSHPPCPKWAAAPWHTK